MNFWDFYYVGIILDMECDTYTQSVTSFLSLYDKNYPKAIIMPQLYIHFGQKPEIMGSYRNTQAGI